MYHLSVHPCRYMYYIPNVVYNNSTINLNKPPFFLNSCGVSIRNDNKNKWHPLHMRNVAHRPVNKVINFRKRVGGGAKRPYLFGVFLLTHGIPKNVLFTIISAHGIGWVDANEELVNDMWPVDHKHSPTIAKLSQLTGFFPQLHSRDISLVNNTGIPQEQWYFGEFSKIVRLFRNKGFYASFIFRSTNLNLEFQIKSKEPSHYSLDSSHFITDNITNLLCNSHKSIFVKC